jgi:hypothetical protein
MCVYIYIRIQLYMYVYTDSRKGGGGGSHMENSQALFNQQQQDLKIEESNKLVAVLKKVFICSRICIYTCIICQERNAYVSYVHTHMNISM